MDCARASDLLSLYIDEMLDETQAHELRLHLEECARCRAEYEQLARMRTALLGVPDIPLPDGFDEWFRQTAARMSEETRNVADRSEVSRSRRKTRIWASAAAVFAVGLLSVFIYQNTGGGDIDSESLKDAVPASSAEETAEIAQDEENSGVSTYVASISAETSEPDDIRVQSQSGESARAYTDAAGEISASHESYDGFGYPARGTTTGAHRLNEKALYDEMLKEKLEGWNYTILWEEKRDGDYVYRVNMISNDDGATFNQEIEVVISGNVLRILYATEFMGL
jgi:hypothetical protein